MAQADVLGPASRRRQQHFRRAGVGVFVQEVMLHLPGVIEAQFVGQNDLGQRILEQAMLVAIVPGAGKLKLVENAKAHGCGSLVLNVFC